ATNSAHPIHTDGAVAQRQSGEGIVRDFPFALAKVSLRLRNFAHDADKQPYCEVGHLLIQYIWRICNNDISAVCIGSIDRIISDPVAGDNFEIGKSVNKLAVNPSVTGYAGN